WMEIDQRPTRRTVLELASRSPRSP
ncbi:MAG: hypothetical protein QG608_2038, partial [Actinomycetota bacterium]|nr:hypothetical protein [Actinomycetota bacterium]